MLGAIIGDYVGSIYEWHNVKTTDFPLFSPKCRFTDDSVMTVAVADALMNGQDVAASLRRYGRLFPRAGYGGRFRQWLASDDAPAYGSFGNGSAMRVSPAGWMADSLEDALRLAELSALPTHDHPEGLRGAKVVAGCIWQLRHGMGKDDLRRWVGEQGYALNFTLDEIRPRYKFDVTCQGSVPQAIEAFLEAEDFEQAIRLAVSIGGDSDTLACIAGALAEAFYGVPPALGEHVIGKMPPALREPTQAFRQRYCQPRE